MKTKTIGAVAVTVLWALLTAFAWFAPVKEISETERRPLAQLPQLNVQTLLGGKFMKEFESYTTDQFPLREQFRGIKALFHTYALQQKDKDGLYLADGHAAEMLYPLNEQALEGNLQRLQLVYERYLKDSGSQIYAAVIPDKGYYLAEKSGHLAPDYEAFFETVAQQLPWATHVKLTDCLMLSDYYRTDLHWRQENLFAAADRLCEALGVTPPDRGDYTQTVLERPFYGVYYGQAAMPMTPDQLVLLENDLLRGCTVYDYENEQTSTVYNRSKLTSKDLYDVFLSGARSLLTIENPNAGTDRELVIFRDSFASSMTPLLLQDYAKVTLVDIRYLSTENLGNFLEINGQDVLFLYSVNVLNTEGILR